MRKNNKKEILKNILNTDLCRFSDNMLRIFLPILIILSLYTLSYVLERGEYAGAYTYRAASEMLEKIFLSLTLLLVGVFAIEYNIRHGQGK